MGHDHDGNGVGEPVKQHPLPHVKSRQPVSIPQTSDEFDASILGLQWQWHANHKPDWHSLSAHPGWLRLFARRNPEVNLQCAANLLLQKFPAQSFEIETLVEFNPENDNDETGLIIIGQTHAALAIRQVAGAKHMIFRENGTDHVIGRIESNRVFLRLRIHAGGKCTFQFSENSCDFQPLSLSFHATAGIWIGAKIGIYCLSQSASKGYADFDYFRFSAYSVRGRLERSGRISPRTKKDRLAPVL